MTPQMRCQDVLRGWHAAQKGEILNPHETAEWTEGWTTWARERSQTRMALRQSRRAELARKVDAVMQRLIRRSTV